MSLQNIPCAKWILSSLLVIGLCFGASRVDAADLPSAEGSALAGIAFDDHPLLLPVQRNFQMAMLTASSELGRSCGEMEAYGWRLSQAEQKRVDQVFNATVDKMRAQGFDIETKAPHSVSRDITIFTADRPDKNLLFMWSAGEVGLVLVVCETSAPVGGKLGQVIESANNKPASEPQRDASLTSGLADSSSGASRKGPSSVVLGLHNSLMAPTSVPPAAHLLKGGKAAHFTPAPAQRPVAISPVGDWSGSYACSQGTTGGTLSITRLSGEHFDGFFKFYPTFKSPNVLSGSYTVSGDYDAKNRRILINPIKWIKRPAHYYNTIMIGHFDPEMRNFSAYFQGITGCTSFEAQFIGKQNPTHEKKKAIVKKHHAAKTSKHNSVLSKLNGAKALPVDFKDDAPGASIKIAPAVNDNTVLLPPDAAVPKP